MRGKWFGQLETSKCKLTKFQFLTGWSYLEHLFVTSVTQGAEARIGEAAEAGAEDGGCRLEEAARPRTRLPVHRLRPERSLQLRRDATAGKKFGRTSARTTARSFLSVDHP